MKNSKAILQVPGTMKIISAEIPVPKEDEVLIKVEYVGMVQMYMVLNQARLFLLKTQIKKLAWVMNAPGRLWLWEAACANLNRGIG